MKYFAAYVLTAGLILSTGCSKEEEATSTQIDKPVDSVITKIKDVTPRLTQEAKDTAENFSKQTIEAIQALDIKPETVLDQLNESADAVKEKVESYNAEELIGFANTYKEMILDKKEQLLNLSNQFKALPMAEKFTEKGLMVKRQVAKHTKQIAELKDRLDLYLDKLKSLGFDISSFGL